MKTWKSSELLEEIRGILLRIEAFEALKTFSEIRDPTEEDLEEAREELEELYRRARSEELQGFYGRIPRGL